MSEMMSSGISPIEGVSEVVAFEGWRGAWRGARRETGAPI
jgi:hypothetical protein